MVSATAPAKIILFGEHAVVYGRPALAAPVAHLRARAIIEETGDPDVRLIAPDLNRSADLSATPSDNPLAAVIRVLEGSLGRSLSEGYSLSITSDIPIASGLGSGAAISIAIIRAFAHYLGLIGTMTNEAVSRLAYEVEKLHHGTPSGIDNTVIAYERPVYFVRREPENIIDPFAIARPLRLVIGDTGIRSATKDVVGDVRQRWTEAPEHFETIFDACGCIADAGRSALAAGDMAAVGELMNENQMWLERMTVSSPQLERLIDAARGAGALGAKLSGAGRGGNMISLVMPETEQAVVAALMAAGAPRVYISDVG